MANLLDGSPTPMYFAGMHRNGSETEVIADYRRAIKSGLRGERLRDAMVGLGSALRTAGKLTAARRLLLDARKRFPRDPVVILFLALVEHDDGNAPKALRQVADAYLGESRDPGIEKYRSVLRRKFHGARG